MPLEIGAYLSQLQQFGSIEGARFSPRRIEHWRRMTLRKDEPIV